MRDALDRLSKLDGDRINRRTELAKFVMCRLKKIELLLSVAK